MALRTLELCAGIGGMGIGLEIAGVDIQPVCYVEHSKRCVEVLQRRFADGSLGEAPIWDDLNSFCGKRWRGCVDIALAGFPCQPFSPASRGRRVAVDLWPQVLRVVEECEARAVFCENVDRFPIERAAKDLRALGYVTRHAALSAADLGAPTRRKRWWLLAVAHGDCEPRFAQYAEVASSQALGPTPWSELKIQPGVLGVGNVIPDGVDRHGMLGNAVAPIVAAATFRILAESLGLECGPVREGQDD